MRPQITVTERSARLEPLKRRRETLSPRGEPRLLSVPVWVIWLMQGRGDVGQHSSSSPTSAAGARPRSLSLETLARLMGLKHHHQHLHIHSSSSILKSNNKQLSGNTQQLPQRERGVITRDDRMLGQSSKECVFRFVGCVCGIVWTNRLNKV